MKLDNFDYILPTDRIAQSPAEPRDSAKLLIYERQTGQIDDRIFRDISSLLGKNDILVLNETHVIPARLKGQVQDTGKECEIFLHTRIGDDSWDCLVYPGKKLKPGTSISFPDSLLTAQIEKITPKGRTVKFSLGGESLTREIEKIGQTPLPPYIKNSQSPAGRYQTVYHNRQKSGSVAAPTAGLHFTPELIKELQTQGVQIEKVCLHVGLGTFSNVEVDDIADHHMHSEYIEISPDTAQRLNLAKSEGKRIIAVGTTSVRTLESMTENGQLQSGAKHTNIFIYPGYEWKFVDSIITNFHLPKSTLLMLVSSFIGDDARKRVYQHGIDSEYRFFSFGDAMWLI